MKATALPTMTPKSHALIGPRGLRIVSFWLGVFLWFPAFGVNVGPLSLQPADLVVVAAYPLVLAFLPRVTGAAWIVLMIFLLSAVASFVVMNGNIRILLYYILFPMPFLLLVFLICRETDTAANFIKGFAVGGSVSLLLYMAQLFLGSASLDFRTNRNFSAPNQFARGFALFPEVSTFATHAIYLAGITLVCFRSRVRKIFSPLGYSGFLALFAIGCLVWTRSSSVILVAPLVLLTAILITQQASRADVVRLFLLTCAGMLLLQYFLTELYVDRAGDSASRSMILRGITMLTGASVLTSGEIFGVGLGNNHEVTLRAIEIGQRLGFTFFLLPEGVNSFVFARIFEEGYGALIQFLFSLSLLVGAFGMRNKDVISKAILVLCVASLLVSLLVTGYRGIYLNWFWLIAPAAVLVRGRKLNCSERL